MLQFTPSSISNTSQPGVLTDTADISVGHQSHTTCFSFNFTSVNFGCDSKETPCSVTFTGFQFDHVKRRKVEVISKTVSIPACPRSEKCALTPLAVSGFDGVTSITVQAETDGKPTTWWADDFAFGWFQDTCEYGLCRSRVLNGNAKPGWAVVSKRAASKLMSFIGVHGW
ncbi:hypothetical protein F4802DRAFT_244052 [Xylaria palmicola]|nr:hypothetical protein F4802DRAFT_244052 [Xylaria palmicola]